MPDLSQRLQSALADRYRIERELGRGGMAVVFLAEDLRHHRRVAVKVLDPGIAAAIGSERFLREIETVAQLTHPHIVPLHDSGVADGLFFYVMPFVAGESLRDRLAREKQLPVEDALRIAREVADALSYAHAHGLVHRDVKPENILLEEGHAVVADFGIARAVAGADGEKLTATGIAVGTPAYMSPEQAVGAHVPDGRSDLYSLGCVLYEMLAGQPPFTGPTAESLVHQHLSVTPRPVTELRPSVPAGVAAALQRALAKVPADRFDLVAHFGEALSQRAAALPPLRRQRWPKWMWAVGAGVGVSLAVVAAMTLARLGESRRIPRAQQHQLTDEGTVGMAALSPDGEYLAYRLDAGPGGKLMVKDLKGGTRLVVADSVGETIALRWSPDGTRLGLSGNYRGRRGLYLFPRLGGTPQSAPYSLGFAWSPDGARTATWRQPTEQGIQVVDVRSGQRDSLGVPGPDRWIQSCEWSPSGELLALVTSAGNRLASHLWVLNPANGSHTLTLADSVELKYPHWAPGGEAVYFLREADLYRVGVDRRNGRARGAAQKVLSLEPTTYPCTFSADGRKLVYTRSSGYWNYSIARVGAAGRTEQQRLTTGTANKAFPALSPDGTELAFLQITSDGWDLFRVPTEGGTPERLTFGGQAEQVGPAWDPTGRRLAFVTKVGIAGRVAVIAANGGQPRVFGATNVSDQLAWAPSSRIAYQLLGRRNFSLLDPDTGAEQLLVQNESAGWMFNPAFSPDGNWVAVAWNRGPVPKPDHTGRSERGLWLISLKDGLQVRLSDVMGRPVEWSRDGQSVYARGEDGILRRHGVSSGRGRGVVLPEPALVDLSCTPYERPGGLVWVCTEGKSWSDAWMIEDFDADNAATKTGEKQRSTSSRGVSARP